MCGIAGFQDQLEDGADYPARVTAMLARIAHRGPDEAGYYVDDRVALGTVRLSILDLKHGQQPMQDVTDRYWIAYNGELYNFIELRAELENNGVVFTTQSDTEVLLQSWIYWGKACLPELNGAFAFVIYDRQEQTLFIARDRYGKRPLFYTQHGTAFYFASEMKAFLEIEGFSFQMDQDQLAAIVSQWTPLPDQTGFVGVHQLPMSSLLTLHKGQLNIERYASLSLAPVHTYHSEQEAIEHIREGLEQSVRLRLRSDVEVGVYLSGGLDSSIITYLTKKLSRHTVSTFSVAFEDQEFDESAHQQTVAKAFGTRHTGLTVSHQNIVDTFPAAIYHAEVPAFRTAFVPMYLLSEEVRRQGIKVVLTGEGADEVFLGYNIFSEVLLRSQWDALDGTTRKARLSRLYPHLSHFDATHHAHLLGLYQQFSKETMPGLFSHEMRFQNGRFSKRLLKGTQDPFSALYALIKSDPDYAMLSVVQKAQWLEFYTLLAGYLLSTQGERMSLAHGVENRCPFLDPGVVSIGASTNLQFDDGTHEKYLLKKSFESVLPATITARYKQPYRAPESAAFVAHQPAYLDEVLSDSALAEMEFLNPVFVRALIKKIWTTDADQISTKENQTFVFLLSIALLHKMFVKRQGLPIIDRSLFQSKIVKAVDLRGRL
jgi:asparagine synthase (glutamine-hydrolysing)